MKMIETRLYYENLFKQSVKADYTIKKTENNLIDIWKTNHSLQLTRTGFHCIRLEKLPTVRIQINNGRSVSELLMLANTMDVPYYITEIHMYNTIHIDTLNSDRTTMLIMHDGNVPNWASMYRTN